MEQDNDTKDAMTEMISVLLVDDQDIILDGISSMMKRFENQIKIVGKVKDAQSAIAFVTTNQLDIVITDVRLKNDSGIDLCREISKSFPDVSVVMLTVYDDEQYLFQALRSGAKGFLLKQITAAELLEQLLRVQNGDIVVDPQLAGRVALSAARLHSGEFWPGAHLGLTQRESEVLDLVTKGNSNKAIAAKLFVGEETVKTHLSAVYRKLGVKDRTAAVALAMREAIFR
ncbi:MULTISPECIES: response regulator transcription factor [Acidithrix]|uniref:Transcriptional regulatory protein DegU n=1 Tax=Acidithrix ferrooxidans TaxID=1280514 RepID=A0A0D8HKJ5_9ACTN|nr:MULTISPECIES: response regulator transcription factor [Acidithrix]KJF18379.1 transcriptional regulatory protein DegU [Acidithrix ferrooxidans]